MPAGSAGVSGDITAAESHHLKDLESGGSGSDDYVDVNRFRQNVDDSPRSNIHSLDLPGHDNEVELGLLGGESGRSHDRIPASSESRSQSRCCTPCLRGPVPPRKHRIEPLFRNFQTAPIRLVDRLLPTRTWRISALVVFFALWATIFLAILNGSVAGPQIPEYGMPVRLPCEARLWHNGKDCGLDGDACRPFDDAAFAFRCPSGCQDSILREPYTVGNQEINYKSLVVGGTSPGGSDSGIYRGDSFICVAALHAGVIDNAAGGCGVLRRTGEKSNFGSLDQHGISSIPFDSYFPSSYTFEGEATPTCRDPRWLLLAVSVFFTAVLSLFTTSPALFYTSVYAITYFQVALVSDPPYSSDYIEVVSIGMGRFLPAAFVGWAIYYFCARATLRDLTAQWEKTILWLGPFWVGALNTDTFDRLPISRLTPHDIQQQPGAIPVLIILVTIMVLAVGFQAWAIWAAGKLPRYLLIYGVMASALLVMVAFPLLNLRIHHYILALLFLPGTAFQTRPCLIYQGLLVGLFINGIARWGFDSILQTPAALLGDAQLGSLLPNVAIPTIHGGNITFSFPILPAGVAGIGILVNDVLRFHAYRNDPREDSSAGALSFDWSRRHDGEREYFRFAYMKTSALGGTSYEDFTKAGLWQPDGTWVHMAPGPSR